MLFGSLVDEGIGGFGVGLEISEVGGSVGGVGLGLGLGIETDWRLEEEREGTLGLNH